MPTDYNPTPTAPPAATTFRRLVNGDALNEDNLVKEVSPGAKPKVTKTLLLDYIFGIAYPPGSTTRVLSIEPYVSSGTWIDEGLGAWKNTTHTGDSLYYLFPAENAPHGATLTGVTAHLHPAGSHGGLPQFPPSVTVVSQTVTQDGGTYTTIVATPDPSANTTAYELQHPIAITGQSVVIDRTTTRYGLAFTGESGTNALNNLRLTGITTTWTY